MLWLLAVACSVIGYAGHSPKPSRFGERPPMAESSPMRAVVVDIAYLPINSYISPATREFFFLGAGQHDNFFVLPDHRSLTVHGLSGKDQTLSGSSGNYWLVECRFSVAPNYVSDTVDTYFFGRYFSGIYYLQSKPHGLELADFSVVERSFRNIKRGLLSFLHFAELFVHCIELSPHNLKLPPRHGILIDAGNCENARKNGDPSVCGAFTKPPLPPSLPPRLMLYALCGHICGLLGFVCITWVPALISERRYGYAIISGVLGIGFVALVFLFAHLLTSPNVEYTVTQKQLTSTIYCNTLIASEDDMANVLSTDKQVAIISALAEGSAIRQIERITGVHRDTIMRLGVRVGKGCASLLDAKMRDLPCKNLQFDEVWGFIGKKERHCLPEDNYELGDAWTFCAIDRDTKLVPAFLVGKRDRETANAFVEDVASRMRNRVQISADALRAYVDAIELAFGSNVDFAQIVKTYTRDESTYPERTYSAPQFVIAEKRAVVGRPDMRLASTSHIERLNGTTRLHMRRLTRLTYAFSKKLENFEAAVALHFAYYNLVKRHGTLRCTPAMAAGVESGFWTVGDLIEAAA